MKSYIIKNYKTRDSNFRIRNIYGEVYIYYKATILWYLGGYDYKAWEDYESTVQKIVDYFIDLYNNDKEAKELGFLVMDELVNKGILND